MFQKIDEIIDLYSEYCHSLIPDKEKGNWNGYTFHRRKVHNGRINNECSPTEYIKNNENLYKVVGQFNIKSWLRRNSTEKNKKSWMNSIKQILSEVLNRLLNEGLLDAK